MRTALVTAVVWGALTATAHAQEPNPPSPTPTPPPEEQQPAEARLTLAVDGTIPARGRAYALTGDRLRAVGRMDPAAAGERVLVRFFLAGRKRREKRVRVAGDGSFDARWRAPRRGRVRIVAVHPRSDGFARAKSGAQRLRVLRARLGAGSSGPLVRLYQRGLARLGYAVSRSGSWDDATARASMAYRKVNGMARRFAASRRIVRRVLHRRGAFKPRHQRSGRYVEADLSRQVLALIKDGKPVRVYHTSSGAPATPTVLGTYRVYMKQLGTNSKGMVHSSYFIRGYAIHGYASVPPYTASHGCLRVPIPNAWFIYNWVKMGTPVTVYP